jgi:hypothetical protein
MTSLLLNRGDPGAAALKEAGPADSEHAVGRSTAAVTDALPSPSPRHTHALSLPFGVFASSLRVSLRPAIHREKSDVEKPPEHPGHRTQLETIPS